MLVSIVKYFPDKRCGGKEMSDHLSLWIKIGAAAAEMHLLQQPENIKVRQSMESKE